MMGNEVHTAHDGLEAVGAATAFQPEVVLLDLGLPKLNGYEAARRIREQDGGTGMVLVAVTGWGQEEDRRRSKEAGFDHHMTKPGRVYCPAKTACLDQPEPPAATAVDAPSCWFDLSLVAHCSAGPSGLVDRAGTTSGPGGKAHYSRT